MDSQEFLNDIESRLRIDLFRRPNYWLCRVVDRTNTYDGRARGKTPLQAYENAVNDLNATMNKAQGVESGF